MTRSAGHDQAPMTCQKAQLPMVPVWAEDPGLAVFQKNDFAFQPSDYPLPFRRLSQTSGNGPSPLRTADSSRARAMQGRSDARGGVVGVIMAAPAVRFNVEHACEAIAVTFVGGQIMCCLKRYANGRRRGGIALPGLGALAVMAISVLSLGAESRPAGSVAVGPDKEIFGTAEAADLVAKARQFDPMFCQAGQADREKAVGLYEQAIAAQPGAKINAPLADRVAQLYAFYEDKAKNIRPVQDQARQWWNRSIEATSPKQLLWAQAHMGLASVGFVGGDYKSALAAYKKILDLDVAQMELPDWKAWPDGKTDRGKAALKKEQLRLRQAVEGIQARAAEKQFYVLNHVGKAAALEALQQVAASHKGDQAGKWASSEMARIRRISRHDPMDLPELAAAGTAGNQTVPPQATRPATRAAAPFGATAGESSGGNWRLGILAFALLGAAFLAAGIVWITRTNRLSFQRRMR